MADPVSHAAITRRLRAAGCVYAEDEASLLLESASGEELDRRVERRVAGLPLEIVLGWAELCGQRFAVAPGVFVPRRRSELVVQEAVRRCGPSACVVDLCCGVGAIGLSLMAARPDVTLHLCDISVAAVAVAERNVAAARLRAGAGAGPESLADVAGPLHGAASRAEVHHGDLFDALPETLRCTVDLVVVNAPYVPTAMIRLLPPEARDHEDLHALDGGHDGLDLHRRIAAQAREWLAPGGLVVIEAASSQRESAAALWCDHGFAVDVVTDDDRDATAVIARVGLP